MKGVIFNVVEEVVLDLHGAAAWDSILSEAGVDGAYTALGDYPDVELGAIVTTASNALDTAPDDLLRAIGEHALPRLAARLPAPVIADDARSFLLQVNDIIHPEVLKIYPDANPPVFAFEDRDDTLVVHYDSARNLGALAEGLLLGCGRLFDEPMSLEALPDEGHTASFALTFG